MNNAMKSVALTLLGVLALGGVALQAAEPVTYTRIYTDAEGESHFEDVALDLSVTELPSGEIAGMAGFSTEGSAMLLVLEPGGFEDWHPSPDPIMLVVKEGQSEVQVTDGDVRIFGPGDIVIMEDTGKGHTTRTVGDERHVALLIPLRPDY